MTKIFPIGNAHALDGKCQQWTSRVQYTKCNRRRIFKEALYRIWCGVNRLGDSGVNRLGDTSAFVNPAGQLLLTRRGMPRMDGVGIVFELYTAPI